MENTKQFTPLNLKITKIPLQVKGSYWRCFKLTGDSIDTLLTDHGDEPILPENVNCKEMTIR